MKNISPNITYSEAVKSITALRNGLDNTPNAQQLKSMKIVAGRIFEPLRVALGNKRFTVFLVDFIVKFKACFEIIVKGGFDHQNIIILSRDRIFAV